MVVVKDGSWVVDRVAGGLLVIDGWRLSSRNTLLGMAFGVDGTTAPKAVWGGTCKLTLEIACSLCFGRGS